MRPQRCGRNRCSFLVAVWILCALLTASQARANLGAASAPPPKPDSDTQLAQASSGAGASTVAELRREIEAQKAATAALEKRLDELTTQQQQQTSALDKLRLGIGRGAETTPQAPGNVTEADIYNRGFYLSSKNERFSLYINGLAQLRYTFFKPNSIGQFGANNPAVNNFDVYLGRLALSGSAFEPDLKYFFQFQGSTAGNSNTVSMLDWFASKTFNPYLTLQAGRSWTFYTYEYYDNPGNYLFPDLSTAEYAFLLQRAIGLQLSGQWERLGYGAEVANSVPAIDAAGQENLHGQLAYIGNLHYDVLAPYGWIESDPNPGGATKPELSLWASGMYNPVEYASNFENEQPGDKVYGTTGSINFRYQYFTFQGSGYYRHTNPHVGLSGYDSWGFGEQSGYYLVPGTWEVAQRISGVWWGKGEIPTTGGSETSWFSGPADFSYRKVLEYSLGLNYYLFGHNAKIQAAYSYLAGEGFNGRGFGANRLWLQSQIMF